jgi:hypothetical protein
MFSPSRYQSIHRSQFKAAASACQSQCSTILIWVRSCAITRSQSPEVFAPARLSARAKMRHPREAVDRALFSSSKALTQTSGLEEDNGNHTDDTSRLSHHTKSLNLAHREKNVRHGWRRFYLRALWTCHLGGFRSFDRQRQSCLSVRRL